MSEIEAALMTVQAAVLAERERCTALVAAAAEDARERADRWEARGEPGMAQAKGQAARDLAEVVKKIRDPVATP